jgi:hypothetical protein
MEQAKKFIEIKGKKTELYNNMKQIEHSNYATHRQHVVCMSEAASS